MRSVFLIIISVLLLFLLLGESKTEPVSAMAATATSTQVKQAAEEPVLLRLDPDLDGSFIIDAIKNHPMPEVSHVLWSKVESKEVVIRLLDRAEASGRFVPAPVFDREHTTVGLKGTLYLSPQIIVPARVGRPLERKYFDIILLHEAVHFEQIDSGRYASTVITDPNDSPDQCEAGWNLEREAYERECDFARMTGYDRLPYCSSDPKAFDRALFAALSAGRHDSCPAHWQHMLGM
ncbi:hypothetical protein HY630_01505 [Candidatus Uhrbacteria bacterium]|nr:hypothetical protein [Candidatus Uhrbacteria bacterium]